VLPSVETVTALLPLSVSALSLIYCPIGFVTIQLFESNEVALLISPKLVSMSFSLLTIWDKSCFVLTLSVMLNWFSEVSLIVFETVTPSAFVFAASDVVVAETDSIRP